MAPVVAVGWELGQAAHIFPGTFDWDDLVGSLAACARRDSVTSRAAFSVARVSLHAERNTIMKGYTRHLLSALGLLAFLALAVASS